MRLLAILSLALLACGLVESLRHRRRLLALPVRILVNGTRGKSSVTRLVAGALREAGWKVVAKTTGSAARVIHEDGSELPLRRPRGARITEQKALARLAAGRGAKALVVECMAVRAESQAAMRRHLVRPTICEITNARVDHVEEMGGTIEDTLAALAESVPEGGLLVTTEPRFADPRYSGAAAKVILAEPSEAGPEVLALFSYPAFADNVALALRVAGELGVDRETALAGMAKAEPDIGVLRVFELESAAFKATVVSAFAANDLDSTALVWKEAATRVPAGLPLALLYNNRPDREYRIPGFTALPGRIAKIDLVAVAGRNAAKTARRFARLGLATLPFREGAGPEAMLAAVGKRIGGPFALFGVGNFHGAGEELMEYCAARGSPR